MKNKKDTKLTVLPAAHAHLSVEPRLLQEIFLDYEMKSGRAVLLINKLPAGRIRSMAISIASWYFVRKTARKFVLYQINLAAEKQAARACRRA